MNLDRAIAAIGQPIQPIPFPPPQLWIADGKNRLDGLGAAGVDQVLCPPDLRDVQLLSESLRLFIRAFALLISGDAGGLLGLLGLLRAIAGALGGDEPDGRR